MKSFKLCLMAFLLMTTCHGFSQEKEKASKASEQESQKEKDKREYIGNLYAAETIQTNAEGVFPTYLFSVEHKFRFDKKAVPLTTGWWTPQTRAEYQKVVDDKWELNDQVYLVFNGDTKEAVNVTKKSTIKLAFVGTLEDSLDPTFIREHKLGDKGHESNGKKAKKGKKA